MRRSRSTGILFWLPRVFAILFVAFISLFALDTFATCTGLGECLLALLMHLIPTAVVAIAVVIAWRRDWLGAILFPMLAVFWVVYTGADLPLGAYLPIAGPPIVIGALFLLSQFTGNRPRQLA